MEDGINAFCPLIGQCVAESLGRGIDSREKIDLWLLQIIIYNKIEREKKKISNNALIWKN